MTRRTCVLKFLTSLFTVAIFLFILAICGVYFFWRALTSPYKGYPQPVKDIEVRKGQRTATILRHFREQGIIRDEYVPLIYIKVVRHGEPIKAGIYEFSRPTSEADVVEKLIRGDVISKTVTVREGL